jgi:hypothetical protein
MAHLGYEKNEYGTQISRHRCEACGSEFTLCPPVYPEQKGWENCLGAQCTSYDRSRDIDLLFDDSGFLKPGAKIEKGQVVGLA